MEQRTRHLFVAKQFNDRSIRPVARLSMFQSPVGTRYQFAYLPEVKDLTEFSPFLSFPALGTVYESDELFPFFENRVMGRNRPEFPNSSPPSTLTKEPSLSKSWNAAAGPAKPTTSRCFRNLSTTRQVGSILAVSLCEGSVTPTVRLRLRARFRLGSYSRFNQSQTIQRIH
jgi:hypothetical protein